MDADAVTLAVAVGEEVGEVLEVELGDAVALDVDVVAEAVLLLVVVGVDVELAVVDGELQIITLDVTTSWYGEGS